MRLSSLIYSFIRVYFIILESLFRYERVKKGKNKTNKGSNRAL